MNINYDYEKFIIKENYSPIKQKNSSNNKINNKYHYDKMPTSIEQKNNLNNNNHKQLLINNDGLKNKNNNINEKTIRKINKIKTYTNKRTYDDKSIKEKIKREIVSNRDLTEPELMIMLNPIKYKENLRNNNKKKNLNISLMDNISQNIFLKHIKQGKIGNTNSNNIKINNQYYSNNINNSINNIRILEKNKGTQIFNNFYSINNIGNSKIPVKVINVFN